MICESMFPSVSNSASAPAGLAFRLLGVLLCVSLLATAQGPQSQQPQQPQPASQVPQSPDARAVIKKQVNLVLVDVTVTDTKRVLVGGLKQSDFELFEDGAPQEIQHFSQDEIPLAIALVVDVSRSMRPIIEPVRNALVRALPTLKAEDRVALFGFSSACTLAMPLSNDYPEIARRILALPAGRGTNVNNALQFAAQFLHERSPSGRRVIILLSDTISDMGNISDRQVEHQLLNFDISLFGIRPAGQFPSYYRDKHLLRVDADHMAKSSGGFILEGSSFKDYEAAMESLIKFLKARYTLGFYPHSSGATASSHEINVLLKNSNRQKELSHAKLNFRQRYELPSQARANP